MKLIQKFDQGEFIEKYKGTIKGVEIDKEGVCHGLVIKYLTEKTESVDIIDQDSFFIAGASYQGIYEHDKDYDLLIGFMNKMSYMAYVPESKGHPMYDYYDKKIPIKQLNKLKDIEYSNINALGLYNKNGGHSIGIKYIDNIYFVFDPNTGFYTTFDIGKLCIYLKGQYNFNNFQITPFVRIH